MEDLKIGDKVRILHTPASIHKNYDGQFGIIDGAVEWMGSIKVRILSDNDWWYFRRSDLEVVDRQSSSDGLKVGDTVRIKSKEWYEANKGSSGNVHVPFDFTSEMSQLCGKAYEIESIGESMLGVKKYRLKGAGRWVFSKEMFDLTTPATISNTLGEVRKCFGSLFQRDSKPKFTSDLPLIKTNKLLTNIKLD